MPVDALVHELLVVQKTILPLECRIRGHRLVGISRWRIPNLHSLEGYGPLRSLQVPLA